MIKSKLKKIVFTFFLTALLIPIALLAWGLDHYKTNPYGYTEATAQSDGISRLIYSKSAISYFVPNKTAGEWLSFVDRIPSDLELLSTCSNQTVCGQRCFVPYRSDDYSVYQTTQAGSQCWLEPLKTRKKYDSTAMLQWNYNTPASNSADRFSCKSTSNSCLSESLFYQPLAVLAGSSYLPFGSSSKGSQGSCPLGWRVPSELDYNNFKTESGCWNSSHLSSSCLTTLGFNIILSGYRTNSGTTYNYGVSAPFLLANREYDGRMWIYELGHIGIYDSNAEAGTGGGTFGVDVRCMKDI